MVTLTVMAYSMKCYRLESAKGKDGEDRAQEKPGTHFQFSSPHVVTWTMLIFPAMMYDDMYEVLPTREAHVNLETPNFYCRLHRHKTPT